MKSVYTLMPVTWVALHPDTVPFIHIEITEPTGHIFDLLDLLMMKF
jgi:hypothetical protein